MRVQIHHGDPIARFWALTDKSGDCWIWLGSRAPKGYPYGIIRFGNDWTYSHRFSWGLHHGPIPTGLHVCHHCDNPPCVNPAHLFLGTHQDNMDDMVRKGRSRPATTQVGEQHHFAKLTAAHACAIVLRLRAGEAQKDIARELGVDPASVSNVWRRKYWKQATAHLW